jgi:ABC-type Fe3+-citrate transport system substrate-binding protein
MEERLTAYERFIGVDFHMEVAKSVEQYKEHNERYDEHKKEFDQMKQRVRERIDKQGRQ